MNELLVISQGWLGYLERWPVSLQLLVGLGPLLALTLVGRRLPRQHPLQRRRRLWTLAAMALGTGLLGAFGVATGLAVFLALVYAGWIAIGLLQQQLHARLDAQVLRQLDSGLLRPLFVIVASLMLLNKIANVDDLAVLPLGSWLGSSLNIGQVCRAFLTLYLLIAGSGPLGRLLSQLFGGLLNLRSGSRRALGLLIRYAVVGVGLVWTLDHLGFNRTALLAVAGGLSVGLGFGVKEVFANFVSGLWLLFEGSVRPGEVLCIDDEACEVRSLGLRAAVVWRERDNTELLIPNQTFLTSTTITFTGTDGMRRCQVEVGAAYHHPPREVMALLVQTAARVPGVLAKPAPVALTLLYNESSVDYALRFWIHDPMEGPGVSSAVRSAIWDAFEAEGIEIPLPQRVLHHSDEQPSHRAEARVLASPDQGSGPAAPG
jgi:potassium efflux system protein